MRCANDRNREPMTRTIAIVDEDRGLGGPSAFLVAASAGYLVYNFTNAEAFLSAELVRPADCVLLNMRRPGTEGLELMRALASRQDPPSILVTSDAGDVALAVAAMKLGAVDFLEKPFRPAKLLAAIDLACMLHEQCLSASEAKRRAIARVASLPLRLRQVLRSIAMGRANKLIAYELELSIRTVEAYRADLYARLGVRSTAEAIRIALAADIDRSGADALPNGGQARRA
jgi:two-component system response regulator FixJ